jgi:hypothetical protein
MENFSQFEFKVALEESNSTLLNYIIKVALGEI